MLMTLARTRDSRPREAGHFWASPAGDYSFAKLVFWQFAVIGMEAPQVVVVAHVAGLVVAGALL